MGELVGDMALSARNPDMEKKILHAVTRIRTWVTAATTQGPNH